MHIRQTRYNTLIRPDHKVYTRQLVGDIKLGFDIRYPISDRVLKDNRE